MANGDKYRLKEDKYSNYRKGKDPILYAKAKQKVTEVADHDDVLIVEDENGMRFSIRKELLTHVARL